MSTVAIVGAGLVGQGIARRLTAAGDVDKLVLASRKPGRLRWFARQLRDVDVELVAPGKLPEADVVVLSLPAGGHAPLAAQLLAGGCDVVSLAESVGDVTDLLALDDKATKEGRCVVIGAGFSPGLSCLLAAHGREWFDRVTEVHVARMGSAGPACQRQLHRARTQSAVDWRDGEWVKRPGFSGRELAWFPDPLGPRDCFRAGLADALLLQPAFVDAQRVTARAGGTRRDRVSAFLPMLRPPHPDGGPGAVRVELRGFRDGEYHHEVLGAIDHPSAAAAAVATLAVTKLLAGDVAAGARGLATVADATRWLRELADAGVIAATFEGVAD